MMINLFISILICNYYSGQILSYHLPVRTLKKKEILLAELEPYSICKGR